MLPTKALYLIMKEAIPNSIERYEDDFETRLKTQKFIYLFDQIWGEDSYCHSWYLAGPYSSVLTHQIYNELLPLLNENKTTWDDLKLSDYAKDTIEQVKSLISNVQRKAKNLSESSTYELVASVWYIAEKKNGFDECGIKNELVLNKPHFKSVDNLDQIIHLVTETKTGE